MYIHKYKKGCHFHIVARYPVPNVLVGTTFYTDGTGFLLGFLMFTLLLIYFFSLPDS